ncbi:MAG: hypothetical protein K2K29_03635 [Muribaculaceae bacterium]|nr:hypothetical protein [Muribaculaceae bacterium]
MLVAVWLSVDSCGNGEADRHLRAVVAHCSRKQLSPFPLRISASLRDKTTSA